VTGESAKASIISADTKSQQKITLTTEEAAARVGIARARALRKKYRATSCDTNDACAFEYRMQDGVMRVTSPDLHEDAHGGALLFEDAHTDFRTYLADYTDLVNLTADASLQTICRHRLNLLEQHFDLHKELHQKEEHIECMSTAQDFYSVKKVDTHIHLAAAIDPVSITRFIRDKATHHAHDVIAKDGRTLGQLLAAVNLRPEDINVERLNLHADESLFRRFDNFNLKYNPSGEKQLRDLFLKADNFMGGQVSYYYYYP
jgi:hypothetical protein